MTSKDEIPDEIYIFNKPIKYYKKVSHSYYTSTAGYKDEMTKYTRADPSPPVPDDVAEAIKRLTADMKKYPYQEGGEMTDIRTLIRAVSTPPVDTINIQRGVLQGVRENVCGLIAAIKCSDGGASGMEDIAAEMGNVYKALAILDAVLVPFV